METVRKQYYDFIIPIFLLYLAIIIVVWFTLIEILHSLKKSSSKQTLSVNKQMLWMYMNNVF